MKRRLIIAIVTALLAVTSVTAAQTPPPASPAVSTAVSTATATQGRAVASALSTAVERWECAKDKLARAIASKANKSELRAMRIDIERLDREVQEISKKLDDVCAVSHTVCCGISDPTQKAACWQNYMNIPLETLRAGVQVMSGTYINEEITESAGGTTKVTRKYVRDEKNGSGEGQVIQLEGMDTPIIIPPRQNDYILAEHLGPSGITRIQRGTPPEKSLPDFSNTLPQNPPAGMSNSGKKTLLYTLPLVAGGAVFLGTGFGLAHNADMSVLLDTPEERLEVSQSGFAIEDALLWGGVTTATGYVLALTLDMAGVFEQDSKQPMVLRF